MSTGARSEAKTFFDWIQPSMAADGLIAIEPWQADHAMRAAAQFGEPPLQYTAMILAALHPHVVDYIAQAPVLVLAAAATMAPFGDLRRRGDRLALATRFITLAGPSHRLPHILRAYGLIPPMRRLSGHALLLRFRWLLGPLAASPEPALAQVIPTTIEEQRRWLLWLENLLFAWHPRNDRNRAFVTWAALNLRTPEARAGASEIADWVKRAGDAFTPSMSYDAARVASEAWHRRVAELASSRERADPGDGRVIDYAPLPTRLEIDGLAFHALATAGSLRLESERMHHCVRTYWPSVASGRSRIYSIRRGERHVATLELRRRRWRAGADGPLEIAQLKGPCNATPETAIAEAAVRCLEAANSAVSEARQAKAAAAREAAKRKRRERRDGGRRAAAPVPDAPG